MITRIVTAIGIIVGAVALSSPALAANCAGTSVGLVPLPDLAGGSYQGQVGGLYADGTNTMSSAYAAAASRSAARVTPRDAGGAPSTSGRVVLLSVGMSNTTQEFQAFLSVASKDSSRDTHVVLVDGAQGGQDAAAWTDANAPTWRTADDRVRAAGVTDAQVQVIWLKQAQANPRSDFNGYTTSLAAQLRTIIANAARRYPNLAQVFISPRTYAGYATSTLNPEPYAYWSGYADKLVIADSVAHPEMTPWVGWGPYLWTDGMKGRSDGFTWSCADTRAEDGTHPSDSGRAKVAQLLDTFFATSPVTTWFRGAAPAAQQSEVAAEATTAPVSSPIAPAAPIAPLAVAGAAVVVLGGATLALRQIRAH